MKHYHLGNPASSLYESHRHLSGRRSFIVSLGCSPGFWLEMRYLSLLLLSLSYIPWAASSREGGNYRDEQRQSSFTASSVKHPLRSSKILSSSTIDQIEQLRTKYRIQGLTIAVVEHQSLAPQEEPDHNRDVAAPVSGHLTSRHVENGWVQETFGFGYRDSRNHTVNERVRHLVPHAFILAIAGGLSHVQAFDIMVGR